MSNQFLRPYAANAIVQHEFDTDHLNIWVTFRFQMDQTVKPAHNLWDCEVDDVAKAVTASAWQDAYTILLTVGAIASHPDRVTLAYDGPSQNLRITWNKQWEPWGAILSFDAVGLPYGCFHGSEINWQQVAAEDVWYTISDADISAGPTHNMIFQNNQEMKIEKAGVYLINYSISIECSIAGKHVLSAIEVNGTEKTEGQMHHEFARANEEATWSGNGIVLLGVNDLVSIGVSTDDPGNPTLTLQHISCTITQIGTTTPS